MELNSLTFITGNKSKAEQARQYLSVPFKTLDLDLVEIQNPDPEIVIKHKIEEAYTIVKEPVFVDDNVLVINSMGKLPGTFVKFFEQEWGYEKICRVVDVFGGREAYAIVSIGYTDGKDTQFFEGRIKGKIPEHPKGVTGFGWDVIFIPEGYEQTRAEMNETDYHATSPRKFALQEFEEYLKSR